MKKMMMKNNTERIKWVFFGTPDIAVYFLNELKNLNFLPDLIVTKPDAASGRKMIMTAPPVKDWALENNIELIQPESLVDSKALRNKIRDYDFFFVFAYGKILPEWLLNLPGGKTLNFHPSLLPKYRGPSPITSMILDDQKQTGVTLMQIDEKMDHGPILKQQQVKIDEWYKFNQHEEHFARIGATMLANVIPDYLSGATTLMEQEHCEASYCGFYKKSDMELLDSDSARKKYLKYCAFTKPFYFDKDSKRIVITDAMWKDGKFIIKKIIPENGREITIEAAGLD